MFKRLLLFCVLVVIVLAAIVLVRAELLKPQEFAVIPVTPLPLDGDGAIHRFIGAIQIPTESKAGQPPDQIQMTRLRDYLQQSFPRVHTTMQREVLPDGALLFTWTGRNPALAPVVLMGHMDVVPASDSASQWKHPPFSGEIAEGAIWGRGTLDDKIHVLSLLEASETLISRGFVPARTILLAFGDDEENGGRYGAQKIVQLLKQRGVHPDFVLDEGGGVVSGFIPGMTRPMAVIGTSEKGYMDVTLATIGKGGHSSEPPPHTAIGELSTALAKLEAQQFPPSMPPALQQQYTSIAPYMPLSKRIFLANLWLFRPLLIQQALKEPTSAGSYRTTTAETMFNAGFKENALPTSARANINFRILPGETTDTVLERVRKVINDPGVTVVNSTPESSRNPSNISSTEAGGYRALSTTIRQFFPNAIVSTNMGVAATDSTFYRALTPNVYGFLGVRARPLRAQHDPWLQRARSPRQIPQSGSVHRSTHPEHPITPLTRRRRRRRLLLLRRRRRDRWTHRRRRRWRRRRIQLRPHRHHVPLLHIRHRLQPIRIASPHIIERRHRRLNRQRLVLRRRRIRNHRNPQHHVIQRPKIPRNRQHRRHRSRCRIRRPHQPRQRLQNILANRVQIRRGRVVHRPRHLPLVHVHLLHRVFQRAQRRPNLARRRRPCCCRRSRRHTRRLGLHPRTNRQRQYPREESSQAP